MYPKEGNGPRKKHQEKCRAASALAMQKNRSRKARGYLRGSIFAFSFQTPIQPQRRVRSLWFFSVCVHEVPLRKTHPLARNWRVNPHARWKKSCPHVRFERFVTGHRQEEEASVVDFMTVLRSFPIITGANLPVQRQERTIYFTTTCFVFFLCGVGGVTGLEPGNLLLPCHRNTLGS